MSNHPITPLASGQIASLPAMRSVLNWSNPTNTQA